jgi:methionyl-tRNA formyltransferase
VSLRILFAGSPEIAVPSLVRIAFEHRIVGVLTNPESRSGRGLSLASTPVAAAAASLFEGAVPILPFARLDAEARATVASLEPELLVSFAYGKIFGPKFLALFPRGGLNVHPSLLPRYRGPTPIPAAILHRDAETGVSVQRLALGMDEGALLGVERIPLRGLETTTELSETASLLGADLLSVVLAELEAGRATERPQEGEPCYCGLLGKDDGRIDWNLPVLELDARVRAYSPWPGAFTKLQGQRLAVLECHPYPGVTYAPPGGGLDYEFEAAEPGTILGLDKSRGIMVQGKDGLIALRRLQLQSKKALPYREFANGWRDLAGLFLGVQD